MKLKKSLVLPTTTTLFVALVVGTVKSQQAQQNQSEAKQAKSAAGQETLPVENGVVDKWLALLDAKATPPIAGSVKRWTAELLPGVRWRYAAVSGNSFVGKIYQSGQEVVVIFPYADDPDDALANDQDTYFGITSSKVVRAKAEGAFYLIENVGEPLALQRNWPSSQAFEDQKAPPTTPVNLEVVDGKLEFSKADSKSEALQNEFYGLSRFYGKREKEQLQSAVFHALDGYKLPGTERKTLTIDLERKLSTEHEPNFGHTRRINGQIISAGETYSFEDNGRQKMYWHVFDDKTKTWSLTQKPLEPNYLSKLLPPLFADSDPGAFDTPVYTALWKDGGLVLRLYTTISDGRNTLRIIALVHQPMQGEPQIVNWCVRHEKVFNNGRDVSHEETDLETRKKAFNHIWYVGPSGEVESELARTDWTNDLVFDVDHEHSAIIYMINGRVYSMNWAQTETQNR